MALTTVEDLKNESLTISGSLGLSEALQLQEKLLHFLQESASLTLEIGEIEVCDITALQLFIAARKTAAASGKTFVITGKTASLEDICEQLSFPLRELSHLPVEA